MGFFERDKEMDGFMGRETKRDAGMDFDVLVARLVIHPIYRSFRVLEMVKSGLPPSEIFFGRGKD